MAVTSLLTLEQFSALPEFDERTGCKYELDHGELIIVSPQGWEHERLKRDIVLLLSGYFANRAMLNCAVVETGFVLDEDSWRRPDAAVISEQAMRKAEQDRQPPLSGAPELSIEIVSPSDTSAMIGRKVDHFLAAGTKTVWVVYPATKQVHVHKAGRTTEKLGAEQFLEEREILPGFRILIAELFG